MDLIEYFISHWNHESSQEAFDAVIGADEQKL